MIVSAIEGRLRMVHPGLKRNAAVDNGKRLLERTPGVIAVEINRLTGSLLVLYESSKISHRSICRKIEQLVPSVKKSPSSALLSSVKMRKYFKIGMLSAIAGSLTVLGVGSEKGHFILGQLFVTLLGVHLFQNRRRLLK